jgi:hypothetical protein
VEKSGCGRGGGASRSSAAAIRARSAARAFLDMTNPAAVFCEDADYTESVAFSNDPTEENIP